MPTAGLVPVRLPPLTLTGLTIDRSPKSEWVRARKAERWYAQRLRSIARVVGEIVKSFLPGDPMSAATVAQALDRYASAIDGWAASTARAMIADVARRDRAAWKAISAEMGTRLRKEIESAPTGRVMQEALARQTELITSLPREAAERVRKLSTEAMIKGTRADEIAAAILETGEVTKARANTIARTEVSRTATELTKARAQAVGSTQFIWRTAGDSDVRPSHKALNGKAFRWDDPPECDPGYHALPGGIFNCRCFPEPILVDE